MKKTNWLTLLLTLCAAMVIVPWLGSAARADVVVSTWSELKSALENAGEDTTVTLTNDVTRNQNEYIYIQNTLNGTLDLNGFTIYPGKYNESMIILDGDEVSPSLTITDSSEDGTGRILYPAGCPEGVIKLGGMFGGNGNLKLERGSIEPAEGVTSEREIISVCDNCTFTMTGGSITGCCQLNGSALRTGVKISNGAFTMENGEITGCSSGVLNKGSQDSSFTMTGGKIASCQYGVRVDNGSFTMTGGSITGNTECGVDVGEDGSVSLSGSPVIFGNNPNNYSWSGNLYLSSGFLNNNKTVTITGELGTDAKIGVTTGTAPTAETPITITSGLSGKGSVSSFFSDNKTFRIVTNGDGEAALAVGMTWSELKSALARAGEGTTITLTNDVTRGNDDSSYLTSKGSTLDLNGFTIYPGDNGMMIYLKIGQSLTITDNSAEKTGCILCGNSTTIRLTYSSLALAGGSIEPAEGDSYNVANAISVSKGGIFTMTGGSITGMGDHGVFIDNGGTFTMENGEITGCNTGVEIQSGSSFTMTGGKIESCERGVQVGNGSFTMTGGSITGNTDNGVDVGEDGSVSLSGSPVIFGNNTDNSWNGNLHLSSGFLNNNKTVTITGELGTDAKIGVKMDTDTPGVFAVAGEDYALTAGDAAHFVSDNSEYEVKLENGQLKLAEKPKPTVTANSATLTLEGQIGVNFFLTIPDAIKNAEGTKVVFVYQGVETPFEGTWPAGGGAKEYKFTFRVPAKEIANEIGIKVVNGDNAAYEMVNSQQNPVTDNTLYYSVETYNEYVNESDSPQYTDKLKKLVTALQNYGAYAYTFFNPSGMTEPTAQPDSISTLAKLKAEDFIAYKAEISGSQEGLTPTSIYLTLESETTINLGFTLEEGHNISEYTFMLGTQKLTPVYKGGEYVVKIENIAAEDLDKEYSVKIGKGEDAMTVTCSALSYAYSVLTNRPEDTDLCNLVKAMYLYNQAANEYFNS